MLKPMMLFKNALVYKQIFNPFFFTKIRVLLCQNLVPEYRLVYWD